MGYVFLYSCLVVLNFTPMLISTKRCFDSDGLVAVTALEIAKRIGDFEKHRQLFSMQVRND